MHGWFALTLLGGCGSEGEPPAATPARLGGTWLDEIVREPSRFTARVADSREGWIALHRNDWPAAVAAGGDPAARAHAELARYYRVLAALDTEAWARLGGHTYFRRGNDFSLVNYDGKRQD